MISLIQLLLDRRPLPFSHCFVGEKMEVVAIMDEENSSASYAASKLSRALEQAKPSRCVYAQCFLVMRYSYSIRQTQQRRGLA